MTEGRGADKRCHGDEGVSMGAIDVDSHWWEPLTWLQESDPELQAELDEVLPPQSFAEVIFGEVIAQLPEDQQQSFFDIPALRAMGGHSSKTHDLAELEAKLQDSPLAAIINQPGARDVAGRLEWADREGIELQLVNPTLPLAKQHEVRRHRPDLEQRLCQAYNHWTLERIDGHTDRVVPTAMVSFSDPGEAVAELTRMREAGSRAFLVPLYPIDGRSLAHADLDDVWAAAVDLEMVPVMHVASGSVTFDPGWCNLGSDHDAQAAFLLASSQNPQIAQVPLAAMIIGGVFDRHPELKVLCSEFGLSWVPGWMDNLGPVSRHGTPNIGILVGWPLPRPAHDYVRDHVRFSPLPSNQVTDLVADLGIGSVLFASDYPHPEGSSTAVEHFREQVEPTLSDEDVEAFYAGNARELLRLPG